MTSALPQPGGPPDLSSASSPSPSSSTPSSSTSASTSSSSPSLYKKVKRTLSTRKNSLTAHLPARLRRESNAGGGEGGKGGSGGQGQGGEGEQDWREEVRAYTIAPPDHRENTTLHALMDSLPSLPSLHGPSLPSFTLPFSSSSSNSNGLRSPPLSAGFGTNCFSAEGYEDSDDDLASPPLTGTPPRRSSDPSSSSSSTPKKPSSSSEDPFENLYGPVIMLGGYRGSVLREASTNKRLWIPLRVGFGFRKADLGMGLDEEDEERSEEKIVPGRMLCQIAGAVDLGQKLKTKLKSISASQHAAQHPHSPLPSLPFSPPPSPSPPSPEALLRPPVIFHSWGYDWRRGLELSSKKLLEFLEGLKRESKERGEGEGGEGVGATVIAHSMGGLVMLHALATAPDPTVIRGIVFAGTPFQGCINVLGALKLGGGISRNPKVGSPETVFSWRSTYYFLPRAPRMVGPPSQEQEQEGEETIVEEPEAEEEGEEANEPLPPPVGTAPSLPPTPPLTLSPPTSSPLPSSPSSTPPPSRPPSRRSSSSSSSLLLSKHAALQSLPPSTLLDPSTHLPPLPTLLSGCFETPAGEPIPVDFFDPASFSRYALSPVTVGMDLSGRSSREGGEGALSRGARKVCEYEKGLQEGKKDAGGGTLPLATGPGNLGEGPSPVDAAVGGVQKLEEEVERVLFFGRRQKEEEAKGDGGECEMRRREEEERLRRQAGEEETVRGYLERCLSRAEKFHTNLLTLYSPQKAHLYPPISIISSRSTPTVRGVLSSAREKIAEEGVKRLTWAEGDGIVLYESATRLPGDPEVKGRKRGEGDDKWMGHLKGVVESGHGHVSLLGDVEAVRKALKLLYG
ncbi:hypothetical protein JCM8547_001334 [Rhodosporidiobolus lusitaniae]